MIRRRTLVSALAAFALAGPTPGAHAALEDFTGTYTGTWNNQTFLSSGPASLVTEIDGAQYRATIDMDGFAFGQPDPPAVDVTGVVSGGDAVFTMVSAGGYGTLDGTIDGDSGDVSFTITGLLAAGIAEVTAIGSFGDGSQLALDYSVTFAGPPQPPAVGTLTVVKAPAPGAAAAGTTALAALVLLSRPRRARAAR